MKKNVFFTLITVVCALLLFSGCNFEVGSDDNLVEKGYTVCVVFDAEGGSFGNYKQRRVYYKPDEYVVKPGYVNTFPSPNKQNYNLDGWFLGRRLVEEEVKITDENGNTIVQTPAVYEYFDPWDFATDKLDVEALADYGTKDERGLFTFNLYAKWNLKCSYTIVGSDSENVYYVNEGDKMFMPPTPPVKTGYTLYGYYKDESLTEEFDFDTFTHPGADESTGVKNVNIYTKWIEGNYKIVTSFSEFAKALSAGLNVYVKNDINGNGAVMDTVLLYSGNIQGNGFTVSNFKINAKQNKDGQIWYSELGIFGKLRNATINALKLTDVTVSVEIGAENGNPAYGFLAGNITGDTSVTNCVFSGTLKTRVIISPDRVLHETLLYGSIEKAELFTDVDYSGVVIIEN